ncbi:MAG TPA: hypothetical protein VM901_12940 [Bdellovibrionota bacterium]|nr:hypothetical protein [Bdellovibrionota bacterium]
MRKFLWLTGWVFSAGVAVGAPGQSPREQNSPACQNVRMMRALWELDGQAASSELDQLSRMVCRFREAPEGHIKYPSGGFAYVGPGYQDSGSWRYPDGDFAFVGPSYQDAGSWKYPNGKFAFVGKAYQDADSWRYPSGSFAYVGPAYQDAGSWKYPNGKFAFVGKAYQDADSWRYPSGSFAYVGPAYQDAGSWKYPDGKFAFAGPAYSDAGTWYYPNRQVYLTNSSADTSGRDLVSLVELYLSVDFKDDARSLPAALRTMKRLIWVQEQLASKAPSTP